MYTLCIPMELIAVEERLISLLLQADRPLWWKSVSRQLLVLKGNVIVRALVKRGSRC